MIAPVETTLLTEVMRPILLALYSVNQRSSDPKKTRLVGWLVAAAPGRGYSVIVPSDVMRPIFPVAGSANHIEWSEDLRAMPNGRAAGLAFGSGYSVIVITSGARSDLSPDCAETTRCHW